MNSQGPRGPVPPNSSQQPANSSSPAQSKGVVSMASTAAGGGGIGTGMGMTTGMQSGMNPHPSMMTPHQKTAGTNASGHSYANSPAINNTANMYSQLENMMNAVKKEAKSLEAVKQKIREMDAMRNTVNELRQKLHQAENKNLELENTLKVNDDVIEGLRNDMQRLNDIYSKEREEYQESQQLNLSLQQEIENIKNEVQFYQKEAQKMPELRKKNAAMLTQIGSLGKQQEEEKAIFASTIKSLENKLAETAKEKQQSAEHFWNLTEENKKLVRQMEEAEEKHAGANKLIDSAVEKQRLAEDQSCMIAEDQLAFLTRERDGIDVVRAELAGVQAEARSLRSLIDDKEEQQMTLHAKLRNIEEARVKEKAEVKGRMASLNETISSLKSKNHELERENSEAQHQLGLVSGDVGRYTMEVEHLQAELSRKDVKQKQHDAEWQRKLDESIRQKDDAVEKLNKATTNFEAMQNQARESQSRYWEELQRVKEAESQLTEEAEHLATELEEKSAKLIAVEAERGKLEEYMRSEVSGAMEMTNALRGELERRLEELTAMRKERDESQEDRAKFEAQVAETKAMMTRQEQTFQRTLENDRNKISGEIKAKMNKLRGLEVEKQELLMETSNLMKEVETTQKDLNRAKLDLEKKTKEATEATMRVAEMQDEAVEMEKRLKTYAQTEDELRAHANRLESSFKEDIARLDNLVKESKKAAAQQVLEIGDRVKAANEEVDMMKVRVKDAQEHEQKSIAEAEKSKTELEIATKSHEDMQQQMAKDMTTLRRELQDMRNKQKIHAESRTKMEMETMNARLEATKAENEANKAIEWAKEMEGKLKDTQEEARKYKKEANEHERELKKTQLKRVEAEEGIVKKQAALERMTKDMAKLEREGLVEVRRMRVNLQVAEQELNELKPLIPLLQKELAETKAAHERTQASTNETVNGLLEELRNTEDTLSSERKKQTHELEQYRYKLNNVTNDLEKAKEHIEQNIVQDKKSAADKDMRVLQLQQELEHIKEMVLKKEARMEELEKQRQSDRNRIQELRSNLESAERAVMDGKTTLELEQAQRKRLEMRLKTANSASMGAASSVSEDGSHSPSFAQEDVYGPSSVEKRTKMLYGDHEDAEEPIYDGDMTMGAAILDPSSTLHAVGVESDLDRPKPSTTTDSTDAAEAIKRRIMETGIAGDDEDFMAEKANPPMQALLSSSSSAPGILSESDNPQRAHHSVDNSGSPVIAKVQAAIEARSQAESTKASLKAASQQRQYERRQRLEEEREALASADMVGGQDRDAGVGGEKKGMVSTVRERVGSAAAYDASQGASSNEGLETEAGLASGPADVEDSIQRTQMFLRQRLAQRSKGNAAADARSAAAAFATGDGGGETGATMDAQELAAKAYERQRATKGSHEQAHFSLDAPKLSPARPVNSINSFSPSRSAND